MASGEVQTKEGNALEIRPYERFVKSLQERAAENGNSRSFEVGANQMDKILKAETEDEIWDADEGGVVAAKDFKDIEIEIRDYTLAPSSDQFESDLGVYVNIDAVVLQETRGFSPGEVVIINTGAKLIVTKLEQLKS